VATTVLDSALFRDSFGTPRMREIFEERALVARYVEVEVALARRAVLERLTDPANYLGMAPQMVDRVVGGRK